MRVVIQRVSRASVTINGSMKSEIKHGLLVLCGFEEADNQVDFEWMCKKISNLRIFNDEHGVMNLSCVDVQGDVLLVSQFTLYASTQKGNRPSYIKAAKPEDANKLYHQFVTLFKSQSGVASVNTGEFGADMKVDLCNDGPVTIIIDSKNKE